MKIFKINGRIEGQRRWLSVSNIYVPVWQLSSCPIHFIVTSTARLCIDTKELLEPSIRHAITVYVAALHLNTFHNRLRHVPCTFTFCYNFLGIPLLL